MPSISITDLTIAVVEPSIMQGKVIIKTLNNLGLENLQYYAKGLDCLDGIRKFPPDLVISSMYLPDMTGVDVVTEIRNDPALEAVPFMLISSETSFAMLEPIRQAGVVAILPKPFAEADLKRALSATVEYLAPDDTLISDLQLEDLRVLVVDDSITARKQIARVLTNLGITRVEMATDGTEAAEMIDKQFYDLLVTDYNMPEMDGEALTRYVREHSSQASIPVLMVTSEQDDSRLRAVQQAGVSGVCDKPFDPATVKRMIHSLLADH